MPFTKCIFCENPLDGSDEHIIPQALNGRLHSKQIICASCNSNVFGRFVDPALPNLFKSLIHILNLKNARGIIIEDPSGKKYIQKPNNGGLAPIAPEVTIAKHEGMTHINISGDPKNVAKLFAKRAKEFFKHGVPVKYNVYRDSEGQLPLSTDFELRVDNNVNLAINKIALEFYAYSTNDSAAIEEALANVGRLGEVTNVTYCNFKNEVRSFEEDEISHLVAIRTDSQNRLLAYVEIFNLVCAIITLNENYNGSPVTFTYRQDAISGKRLETDFAINLEAITLHDNGKKVNNDTLEELSHTLFERLEFRQIQKAIESGTDQIRKDIVAEFGDNPDMAAHRDRVHQLIGRFIAELTIYHFPYSVADITEEQRHQINYIHSSINEDLFEAFKAANKHLIGTKLVLKDSDLDRYFALDSFMTSPVAKWNGKKIVKIFCVLKEEITGDLKYYPFRVIFDSLRDFYQNNDQDKES